MTCATEGCQRPTSGKSKYCSEHKAEARAAWKAMVAAQGEAKAVRDRGFAQLWEDAVRRGREAGERAIPDPMIVERHANPMDDASPVTHAWLVSDGVCGFAWVTVRPGNSPFANWLKKQGYARPAYHGGVQVWISDFDQSMQRKEAMATVMADTFRAMGIKAYAGSRMD